jgi:hypothetical protein
VQPSKLLPDNLDLSLFHPLQDRFNRLSSDSSLAKTIPNSGNFGESLISDRATSIKYGLIWQFVSKH